MTAVSVTFDKKNNQGVNTITAYYNNSSYTPSNNNEVVGGGWHNVTSIDYPIYPVFAYGLYKFSSEQTDGFFYIDYRDSRYGFYGEQSPPLQIVGHNADLWIKYNESQNKYYYCTDPSQYSWIEIKNGDYLTIWDIKNAGMPNTSTFENYWENCLSVVPKYNSEGGVSPALIWGPNSNIPDAGYKIYRSIVTGISNPPTYSFLTQVLPNSFVFLDEQLLVTGSKTAYYKVKAYNSSEQSGYSNAVHISTLGIFKHGLATTKSNENFEFSLAQNYPNPFNPTTIISYTINNSTIVRLMIFDVLGRLIEFPINKYQKSGSYMISFNASNLPSGIYFNKLDANQSSKTRMMFYVK